MGRLRRPKFPLLGSCCGFAAAGTEQKRVFGGTTFLQTSLKTPTANTSRTVTAWTSEVAGEDLGSGPRKDTGTYDSRQWAGETQQPSQTPGDTWTGGEVAGEGLGSGPRKDTGTYDSRQWVGEGQGDRPTTDDTAKQQP